jgi:hypothetical protein
MAAYLAHIGPFRSDWLKCAFVVITVDKITVEGNYIEHIAGDGIICSADNASLIGNAMKYFYKINDNHDDGIQFHRGRVKTTPIYNALVSGNSVIAWDNAVNNPLLGSPQGICNFDIPALNWRIIPTAEISSPVFCWAQLTARRRAKTPLCVIICSTPKLVCPRIPTQQTTIL